MSFQKGDQNEKQNTITNKPGEEKQMRNLNQLERKIEYIFESLGIHDTSDVFSKFKTLELIFEQLLFATNIINENMPEFYLKKTREYVKNKKE